MDTTIYTYIGPAGTDGGARVHGMNRLRYTVRCQPSGRLLAMANCRARAHRRGDISVTSVKVCLWGASGPRNIDVSVYRLTR